MNFCFITIRESMTLLKTICNHTALPSSRLCCGCDQSNSGYGRPDLFVITECNGIAICHECLDRCWLAVLHTVDLLSPSTKMMFGLLMLYMRLPFLTSWWPWFLNSWAYFPHRLFKTLLLLCFSFNFKVNLASLLNDPRPGRRQPDFFTKTWGVGWDYLDLTPSPDIPDIQLNHLKRYQKAILPVSIFYFSLSFVNSSKRLGSYL